LLLLGEGVNNFLLPKLGELSTEITVHVASSWNSTFQETKPRVLASSGNPTSGKSGMKNTRSPPKRETGYIPLEELQQHTGCHVEKDYSWQKMSSLLNL
jgi:hypothetical protein